MKDLDEDTEEWDEKLEKHLGKKRCCVCGDELTRGDEFLLKDRDYHHPRCYLEKQASSSERSEGEKNKDLTSESESGAELSTNNDKN